MVEAGAIRVVLPRKRIILEEGKEERADGEERDDGVKGEKGGDNKAM